MLNTSFRINLTCADTMIDLVITLNDTEQIGVEVKNRTISGFKQMRSQIVHGQNLGKLIPESVDLFKEFRLVIVLLDYPPISDLSFANELSLRLSGINPRIKLIFGFIDNRGNFKQI